MTRVPAFSELRIITMLALLLSSAGLNIAITGSSQGIGLSAAKTLIDQGHTVFHACRSEERAEIAREGAGGGIPMVCDLADLDSVCAIGLKPHSLPPRL